MPYIIYFLVLHCLCQLSIETTPKFSSRFYHVKLCNLVIWKYQIITTVILVIASIEGKCTLLLHWFAINVQSLPTLKIV